MRGDVHRLFKPRDAMGHEQAGQRYAVVLQADFLPLSTLIVVPTSTSARPTSFRPEIEIEGRTTLAMVEQVMCVPLERLGDRVCTLSRLDLQDVERALAQVLGS